MGFPIVLLAVDGDTHIAEHWNVREAEINAVTVGNYKLLGCFI